MLDPYEAKKELEMLFEEMRPAEFAHFWQQYCEAISDYDRILYPMSDIEDFLYNLQDAGYTLVEIIKMTTGDSFDFSDTFFKRGRNGKLVSFNHDPFEVKDFVEIAEYLVEVDPYAVESDAVDEIISEMGG